MNWWVKKLTVYWLSNMSKAWKVTPVPWTGSCALGWIIITSLKQSGQKKMKRRKSAYSTWCPLCPFSIITINLHSNICGQSSCLLIHVSAVINYCSLVLICITAPETCLTSKAECSLAGLSVREREKTHQDFMLCLYLISMTPLMTQQVFLAHKSANNNIYTDMDILAVNWDNTENIVLSNKNQVM